MIVYLGVSALAFLVLGVLWHKENHEDRSVALAFGVMAIWALSLLVTST